MTWFGQAALHFFLGGDVNLAQVRIKRTENLRKRNAKRCKRLVEFLSLQEDYIQKWIETRHTCEHRKSLKWLRNCLTNLNGASITIYKGKQKRCSTYKRNSTNFGLGHWDIVVRLLSGGEGGREGGEGEVGGLCKASKGDQSPQSRINHLCASLATSMARHYTIFNSQAVTTGCRCYSLCLIGCPTPGYCDPSSPSSLRRSSRRSFSSPSSLNRFSSCPEVRCNRVRWRSANML